jgi:hypothetical protein
MQRPCLLGDPAPRTRGRVVAGSVLMAIHRGRDQWSCDALSFRPPRRVLSGVPDGKPRWRTVETINRSGKLVPGIISISGDQRGEAALTHLPVPGANGEELRIEAGGLSDVDVYTAVVIRALAEYYGSRCRMVVSLQPPRQAATWRLLAALLGRGLPEQFCLAPETEFPAMGSRAAILPTRLIDSLDDNDEVADHVVDLIGNNYGYRNADLMAAAFGVLGENALLHGVDSPVRPIAAIGHERESNVLQLVVTDLGRGLVSADPYEHMIDLVERSEQTRGGLYGLNAEARRKEIDLELRIASSAARLSWRGERPSVSEA